MTLFCHFLDREGRRRQEASSLLVYWRVVHVGEFGLSFRGREVKNLYVMFGLCSGVMRLRPMMGFGFVGAGGMVTYRNGRTGGLNIDFKIEFSYDNLKPELFLERDSGFWWRCFKIRTTGLNCQTSDQRTHTL